MPRKSTFGKPWPREPQHDFVVGDKVTFKDDALAIYARHVPAARGYTSEEFSWRKHIAQLAGKVGTIERVFQNSAHVNVDFAGDLLGVDAEMLRPLSSEGLGETKDIDDAIKSIFE